MTPDPIYDGVDGRFEQHQTIRAPERQLAGALRMRHQADDVSRFVAEARDVRRRAVGIGFIRRRALRVRVAKNDLPVPLEAGDDIGLRVVVAFAVRYRNAEDLS